jgi:hypothetical protein
MTRTILIALAAGLALCGSARAAQVTWEDEACRNVLTYDARKTDTAAVRDTAKLVFQEEEVRPTVPSAAMFTPDDAAKIDVAKLEAECAENRRALAAMKLLPLPGAEDYRTALLDDAKDHCAMNVATARALRDPAALRAYTPAFPACAAYADALEGKTDFDKVWRETVEESCKQNASPKACRDRYAAEAARPDGTQWKRLAVLNFGWNNCAVGFMTINALRDDRTTKRKALERLMKRQFRIVRTKCDHNRSD